MFVGCGRPHGQKLPEEKEGGKEPGPRVVCGAEGADLDRSSPSQALGSPARGRGGEGQKETRRAHQPPGPPAGRRATGLCYVEDGGFWGGPGLSPALPAGHASRKGFGSFKAPPLPARNRARPPSRPVPLTHPAGEAGTNFHRAEGRDPAAGASHFVLEHRSSTGRNKKHYLVSSRGQALKEPRGGPAAPARGRGRGRETIETRAPLWKAPERLLLGLRHLRLDSRGASLEIPVTLWPCGAGGFEPCARPGGRGGSVAAWPAQGRWAASRTARGSSPPSWLPWLLRGHLGPREEGRQEAGARGTPEGREQGH